MKEIEKLNNAEELFKVLLTARQFVRKVTYESQLGVSSVSWRVVLLLDEKEKLKPSEISVLEQTSRATTSAILKRLEAENLIEKVTDPQDGRAYFVRLTKHGKKELAHWRFRIRKVLVELEAKISESQMETLLSAEKIIKNLTDELE